MVNEILNTLVYICSKYFCILNDDASKKCCHHFCVFHSLSFSLLSSVFFLVISLWTLFCEKNEQAQKPTSMRMNLSNSCESTDISWAEEKPSLRICMWNCDNLFYFSLFCVCLELHLVQEYCILHRNEFIFWCFTIFVYVSACVKPFFCSFLIPYNSF